MRIGWGGGRSCRGRTRPNLRGRWFGGGRRPGGRSWARRMRGVMTAEFVRPPHLTSLSHCHAPFLQILNTGDTPLSVDDHFGEQVGEAGAAELGGAGPIQVPVVDGLAVGGGAETWACAIVGGRWGG